MTTTLPYSPDGVRQIVVLKRGEIYLLPPGIAQGFVSAGLAVLGMQSTAMEPAETKKHKVRRHTQDSHSREM